MKFSMSEAWSDATAMMSANREVMLVVAGVFFFLPGIILAMSMTDIQQAMMAADPTDPEQMEQVVMNFYSDVWWIAALGFIFQIVGYLALLALLRDDARPTVGEAIKTGIAGILPALGTYILLVLGLSIVVGLLIGLAAVIGSTTIASVIGMLTFVVFIYAMVKISLAGPVIAIEKVFNPIRVIARSWKLTKGNSFRLLLFYLLIFIVYLVVTSVISVAVMALTLILSETFAVTISGIFSGLASAVVTMVFVAVLAAIHRQLAGPSTEAVSKTFE